MDQAPENLEATPAAQEIQAAPAAENMLHRIFVGPFGLRAGWSLLLYLGIIASFGFLAASAQKLVKEYQQANAAQSTVAPAQPAAKAPPKPQPATGIIIGEGIAFTVFFLLSWLMAAIERRKLSAFGLGGVHGFRRFLTGAFWGLAAMSLLIGSLAALHLLTFDAQLDHGAQILLNGLLLAAAFLLVGLLEEYMFRGYIQFTLTRGLVWLGELIAPRRARSIAFWAAAFITSAFFLYAHTGNDGEDKFGLFTVFLAGVLFLVALWRTGSLWWAIGFHMSWDWAQSFLYGVPDSGGLVQGRLFTTHASGNPLLSGGTVGPEGSVLVVPVLVLAIVVLMFTPASPQPPLEPKPLRKPTTPLEMDATSQSIA